MKNNNQKYLDYLNFLNEVITGDKIVSEKCIEILGIKPRRTL